MMKLMRLLLPFFGILQECRDFFFHIKNLKNAYICNLDTSRVNLPSEKKNKYVVGNILR